jgi:putative NADH-flavin reductase
MAIRRMTLARSLFCMVLCACSGLGPAQAQSPVPESHKIVVYGASGRVGSRIVQEALRRGHWVTAVTRDPARITESHAHLTVVGGDVLDPDSVATTASGHTVVISAIGGSNPESDDPMLSIPRLAAESLVTAMRRLGPGAPRMILVGGGSSTLDERPGVPFVDPTDPMTGPRGARVRGHRYALDLVLATDDVQWTFLSPALEMRPGERTGRYRTAAGIVLRDANGLSAISTEDFAVAMLDEIERPQHLMQQFNVAY